MISRELLPRLRTAAGAAALVAATVVVVTTSPAGAAPSLPSDPSTRGFIGLCDRHNHNVTGGSVHDTPFIWKAVASQPPPKQFLGRGENTNLNIYQPRPGILPGDWSGDQLTGASFYATRRAPAAQATLKDLSLAVIIKEYPPMVDGLYELRMYYGKVNYGLYSATYPATFIKVQGDRWRVVQGGSVNCAASTGESDEVLTGAISPKAAYGNTPPQSAQGRPSSSPSRASPMPGASSTGTSGAASDGAHAARSESPVSNESSVESAAQPAANSAGGSSGAVGWWIVALCVAVGAAVGAAWWRTRRRQT